MVRLALWLLLVAEAPSALLAAATDEEQFERFVRPVLLARCASCHGPEKAQRGLRLDVPDQRLLRGEGSPVVVPGDPDGSLLVRAIRRTDELKMPPAGPLPAEEVAALVAWVERGAAWPEAPEAAEVAAGAANSASAASPLAPDAAHLRDALQAWYRADQLPLADGQPVHVWPDSSGAGRDLSATVGVRAGGVGQPPAFVLQSTLERRPGLRFDVQSGLASSPSLPVAIAGDAGFTLCLVMNLQPHDAQPPFDGVLGIGNPAAADNPGRPWAALVQIQRTSSPELQLAGGWGHDASLGSDSFTPFFNRTLLLTIVKRPGPMCTSTEFYLNGQPAGEASQHANVSGSDAVPEIRHRDDIGLYLGKALAWCGSIRGDLGEVLVYSRPLETNERIGVELTLAERFGLVHASALPLAEARFTPEQRAFWAFQPVQTPALPAGDPSASAIDRLIRARLAAEGLAPAPPADPRVLLRRVTFDLTGLPPTPEVLAAFLAEPSAEAYAEAVERLLASPQYGEHWGRHWLDVVRFAETTANDANAVMRYAWRYRDYVVAALNADLPYDEFLAEQLAGDLLPPTGDLTRDAQRTIALGFWMVGPKALAETDKEQSRLDIIDDQIDVVGRGLLGLTLACARCHDHKFDPIPTVDYYALAGILRSTEVFRDEVRNASMWQERPLLTLPGETPLVAMAPQEALPVNLRVHLRGNRQALGVVAPRRFLQILGGADEPPLSGPHSGRLELARWIASPGNPLTARVLVNRVWQHYFGTGLVATSDNFGLRGERPSHPDLLDWLADDFVRGGWSLKALHRQIVLSQTYRQSSQAPAAALAADPNNRWLSHAPRRRLTAEEFHDAVLLASGQIDFTVGGGDSGELLFAEGEVIDPNRDFFRPNRMSTDHPIYTSSRRRSIYLPVVRNAAPDLFALFDGADSNSVVAVRNETTVPSQALFLLNHPFMREQALRLAQLLLAPAELTDAQRVELALQRALARPAEAEEALRAMEFVKAVAVEAGGNHEAAWQTFCQALLCSNEFFYLD